MKQQACNNNNNVIKNRPMLVYDIINYVPKKENTTQNKIHYYA